MLFSRSFSTRVCQTVVLTALLCLSGVVYGAGQTEDAEPAKEMTMSGGRYSEAPQLAQRVSLGELPPVDERLPEEPLIVEVQEVGVYGGELHYPAVTKEIRYLIRESLAMFPIGTYEPGPGIARDWETANQGREYTFYLRKGHRWSDGEPFTADDIVFWWNDIANNEEIYPRLPSWLMSGDGESSLTKIDDYTVKFMFSNPNVLFLNNMASTNGCWQFSNTPAHYLEQFHPRYVDPGKLSAMLKEAEFDSWTQLFAVKRERSDNPECPTLCAWQVVSTWPGSRMVWERNPYYYKVDTAGNQLPYIDSVISEYLANNEIVRLKAMDGGSDWQYKGMGFEDFTLLKENEGQGGYHVLKWTHGTGLLNLFVNQNVPDPEKKTFFRDVRFREALSHAIDRDSINKLQFFGQAQKTTATTGPEDPYYVEGLGRHAIEYDPVKARRLLDELGLDRKDRNGWRLLPSGKVLEVTIECFPLFIGVQAINVFDIVAENWQEVGIKAVAKEIGRSLWRERAGNASMDINGSNSKRTPWDLDPIWYVPVRNTTWWAPLYGQWFQSGGTSGEEPPEEVKQLHQWWEELTMSPDRARQIELGQKIQLANEENIWAIGVMYVPFSPVIVNNRLRNVLEKGVVSPSYLHEGQAWPEQMFYVGGKRK